MVYCVGDDNDKKTLAISIENVEFTVSECYERIFWARYTVSIMFELVHGPNYQDLWLQRQTQRAKRSLYSALCMR